MTMAIKDYPETRQLPKIGDKVDTPSSSASKMKRW
jgi:hypothetical protein